MALASGSSHKSSQAVFQRQGARLDVRRRASVERVCVAGVQFSVFPGVYDCGGDTNLIVESVNINRNEVFLDLGCGAGVVSVFLGSSAAGGIGVDISEEAVSNARVNALENGITNVTFAVSNVFDQVDGSFDVVVCNPPYSPHATADKVERMFWDPCNYMSRRVFAEVGGYLRPNGRLFFGWSDLANAPTNLPVALAKKHGFRCEGVAVKPMHQGAYHYFVYCFTQTPGLSARKCDSGK